MDCQVYSKHGKTIIHSLEPRKLDPMEADVVEVYMDKQKLGEVFEGLLFSVSKAEKTSDKGGSDKKEKALIFPFLGDFLLGDVCE